MAPRDDVFPELPADTDDDAPAAGAGDTQTLDVRTVSERIAEALEHAFPRPFWLVGAASNLARARNGRGRHWFFDLVEAEPDDPARPASLSVVMWKSTVDRLFGPRGRLRGRFEPDDGAVLKLRVTPNYYAPHGRVSFVIDDVDPSFTLGDLERRRRELLERLAAEGALARNAARPLADPPLRLGLITSVGSAAYEDVCKQLLPSGIGFRLTVCDARVQGPGAPRSLVAALRTLARRELDALLLVRGGGSRLDLSAFDDEAVARAVADCPLPVLVGVGHEIDRSVADEVAHASFKTPTAVAAWLVERAESARAAVEDGFARVAELAARGLRDEHEALQLAGAALRRGARAALVEERHALGRTSRRFARRAEELLARAGDGLQHARRRLVSGPSIEALGRLDAQLADTPRRLRRLAERRLQRHDERLADAERRARLLDPARVLRRGYAYLRRPAGGVLMDAASARQGETLRAVLRDGELELRTLATHPARPAAEEPTP